tara:strand:- start:411 stop:596 length:186 start_codon:yes stop_codon:yes gene_type:complete
MTNVTAIIDTVKEKVIVLGCESEVLEAMDRIVKINGKNDLTKLNRFEVIQGDLQTISNFYK